MKRTEAIATHSRTYDADKPCTKGHWPTKRYTSAGACVTCMQQRYKHTRHPLSRTVIVPPELVEAFDAMCASLGLTQPAVAPDALVYDGEFPGMKP